jgi:hypothetical protein
MEMTDKTPGSRAVRWPLPDLGPFSEGSFSEGGAGAIAGPGTPPGYQ